MRPIWSALAGVALAAAGLLAPFSALSGRGLDTLGPWGALLVLAALLLALAGTAPSAALLVPTGLGSAVLALSMLEGAGGPGYWLSYWGSLLIALAAIGRIGLSVAEDDEPRWRRWLRAGMPPASVPLVLLLLWQGLVLGFEVPKGIFPSIGNVVTVLANSYRVLAGDAYLTFVQEVLVGFSIGLAAGFLVGVAIAYSVFLQRGFLPLAAAFGAVPIVGLAPVLGRAFGVDWESKAAVVVITTFFPVVLNTVAGLTNVDRLKLELLRSYAASPWEIFVKLRLPNALPFLFNAVKLAAVLSVISVIVAEFLIPGPPAGLGQRISLSARRGAYDVVFAAIFVSSAISIVIYGLLTALERWLTSWHASFRERGA
jgi:NitT/TauT family transport system permease protein